jgi:hypothetical protein
MLYWKNVLLWLLNFINYIRYGSQLQVQEGYAFINFFHDNTPCKILLPYGVSQAKFVQRTIKWEEGKEEVWNYPPFLQFVPVTPDEIGALEVRSYNMLDEEVTIYKDDELIV